MPYILPHKIHFDTCTNKTNITEMGAERFGVSQEQFSNWRWQMKHQVQSAEDLQSRVKLSSDEIAAFDLLKEKFHAGISPYAISCIDFKNEKDPIRLQLLPQTKELNDKIGIPDPLNEVTNSPVKELVHVYNDRVAFCVAQLCPVYCRYCFRKRRDEEVGLHFNNKIIKEGVEYLKSNKNIRDVLLTGGDPLIAQDSALEHLLEQIRSIPHIEIIRIGTRVPVSLPYRVTEELADMLSKFHPLWINTHFNSTQEITPEATAAIDTLLRRGIPVGNQSVFLKNVNDSVVQ
ncbi:MAG: KamA family radical SAM protein [Silvanigrellaceae bacterium]|nr:KamA family radical SAM protein [Silvanigrellaceae bacterium]